MKIINGVKNGTSDKNKNYKRLRKKKKKDNKKGSKSKNNLQTRQKNKKKKSERKEKDFSKIQCYKCEKMKHYVNICSQVNDEKTIKFEINVVNKSEKGKFSKKKARQFSKIDSK